MQKRCSVAKGLSICANLMKLLSVHVHLGVCCINVHKLPSLDMADCVVQVMTLFQRGNVIVQSYPYMPDMLAVANAIASDDHGTAAETLLQQGGVSDAVQQAPVAPDAETNKASWLIAPKQEEDFLQTMNIPLMASMMPEPQRM